MMTINPVRAYRLAGQAERANAILERENLHEGSDLDLKLSIVLTRRNAISEVADDLSATVLRLTDDLAAANAKIASMTSELKQHRAKSPPDLPA